MATPRSTPRRRGAPSDTNGAPVMAAPAHLALIQQSHERCTALGLTRIERPDFSPLLRGDLAVAQERNQRLYNHAASVMEMLAEQIVDTDSMIVLTDAHGTILHTVGDDDFLARAGRVALAPGVNWAEQSKGTNAIGTALFEERPTLVHADEHFMHANHFLTCSAAPIFDPRGNMLGVLDVTGDRQSYHQHTMGLVRMSARMIENHWLSDDCANKLRLHFHHRAEFIGTLLEGILVVAPDGHIVGANRSALDQLAMSDVALRNITLPALFGTTTAAILDHFRRPLPVPMQVALPNGMRFHLSARFEWNERFTLGPGSPSDAPAAPAPAPAGSVRAGAAETTGLRYLQTGDAQVEEAVHKARRILNRDIPLLLVGETGTGKELFARAVHQESERAKQAFVAVGCSGVPEAQLEAELFGDDEGAPAGPRRKGTPGRIVQASGGTLFLDEVADLPLSLQARLLRVLQDRSVTPLGGSRPIPVDIAVIAATQHTLREKIERSEFREDLYHHLNGLVLRLPPLRERSDLAALARRILEAECPQGTPQIDADALQLLRRCAWPGNVRQLANVLRTAAVMAGGAPLITPAHLPDDLVEPTRRPDGGASLAADAPEDDQARADADATAATMAPGHAAPRTLEEVELQMIRQAVDAAGGNISEASKRLGVSRNTIYRKLRWGRSG